MKFQTTPIRSSSLDPLPVEFESLLVDVDALARRMAAASDVPPSLGDRVHQASVHLLPGATLPLTGERRRPVTAWSQRRAIIGRLSLAASVGLACLVASQLNTTTTSTTPPSSGEPGVIVASIKPLSTAEEWLLVDRVNDMTPNGGARLVEFEMPRPTAIDGLVEVSALSLDQLASDMRELEISLEM
jgi:hypothetical protein